MFTAFIKILIGLLTLKYTWLILEWLFIIIIGCVLASFVLRAFRNTYTIPIEPQPTNTPIAPVKPILKPFRPLNGDAFKHHTSWGGYDLTEQSKAILTVFIKNNIPLDALKKHTACVSSHIARFRFSFSETQYYSKALKLTDQMKAALNDNNVTITQSGKYIFVDYPFDYETLYLGDVLNNDTFNRSTAITFPIGRTIDGEDILDTIENLRHILVAGVQGSGKSEFLQSMIVSILARHRDDVELFLVDPKIVEFNDYRHAVNCHVLTETNETVSTLSHLCDEMDDRYALMASVGAKNIDEYNRTSDTPMKRIILVIDELADLMSDKRYKNAAESHIVRIAQKARACGIHLVLATQYPKRDVITGLIKNNINTKVCFAVPSTTASILMLGQKGAETLVGKGDMLFQTESNHTPVRVQSPLSERNDRMIAINNQV